MALPDMVVVTATAAHVSGRVEQTAGSHVTSRLQAIYRVRCDAASIEEALDLVTVPPWTWHQFRATADEPLGFLWLPL